MEIPIIKGQFKNPLRLTANHSGSLNRSVQNRRWNGSVKLRVIPLGAVGQSLSAELPTDVMVGKTLVDAQQNCIPVRVVNLSSEPRKICRGSEVASCGPVESVLHQQPDFSPDSQGGGRALLDHLQDRYARSVEGLSNEQQNQLRELLHKFQDIFSRGPHDLGRMGLAKHMMNTGNAVPVRQPPRRLAFAQREKAFKAVEEIHKQEIIKSSLSPWDSPVVLVRNKDGSAGFRVDNRKLSDH